MSATHCLIRIDPAAVYDGTALVCALGVSAQTLCNARRTGALRFTRKGRRVLYLGQWVLHWMCDDPARPTDGPRTNGVNGDKT